MKDTFRLMIYWWWIENRMIIWRTLNIMCTKNWIQTIICQNIKQNIFIFYSIKKYFYLLFKINSLSIHYRIINLLRILTNVFVHCINYQSVFSCIINLLLIYANSSSLRYQFITIYIINSFKNLLFNWS